MGSFCRRSEMIGRPQADLPTAERFRALLPRATGKPPQHIGKVGEKSSEEGRGGGRLCLKQAKQAQINANHHNDQEQEEEENPLVVKYIASTA